MAQNRSGLSCRPLSLQSGCSMAVHYHPTHLWHCCFPGFFSPRSVHVWDASPPNWNGPLLSTLLYHHPGLQLAPKFPWTSLLRELCRNFHSRRRQQGGKLFVILGSLENVIEHSKQDLPQKGFDGHVKVTVHRTYRKETFPYTHQFPGGYVELP